MAASDDAVFNILKDLEFSRRCFSVEQHALKYMLRYQLYLQKRLIIDDWQGSEYAPGIPKTDAKKSQRELIHHLPEATCSYFQMLFLNRENNDPSKFGGNVARILFFSKRYMTF